ncbi:hypothetical protein D3C80_1574370 [compost metagenome]
MQVFGAIIAALGQAGVLGHFKRLAARLLGVVLDLAVGVTQLLPHRLGVTQALAQFGNPRRLAAVLLLDAIELVVEGGIELAFGALAAVQGAFIGLRISLDVVARRCALVLLRLDAECQQHQGQPYHRSHLRHPPIACGNMGADSRSAPQQRTG